MTVATGRKADLEYRAAAQFEDFEWLVESGEWVPRALERVGVSAQSMVARYVRAGRVAPEALVAAVYDENKRNAGGKS
jgi:hypothetical protein